MVLILIQRLYSGSTGRCCSFCSQRGRYAFISPNHNNFFSVIESLFFLLLAVFLFLWVPVRPLLTIWQMWQMPRGIALYGPRTFQNLHQIKWYFGRSFFQVGRNLRNQEKIKCSIRYNHMEIETVLRRIYQVGTYIPSNFLLL